MDDMEIATCGELEHTNDVDTNTGKLCVGGQSRGKVRMGRVEHMGSLSCDRRVARMFVGYGYHVRGQRTEAPE